MTCREYFLICAKQKRARTKKMKAKWNRERKRHLLVCQNCQSVK